MTDAAELQAHLSDPMWRLCNLYKIIVKGDNDEEGLVMQFSPNRAQRRLLARLWHRNIILKARQLGFTTLIAILWLDTALFSNDPIRCGIIAQGREEAEAIFRDKVKFAYKNLPEVLRERFPLERDSANELVFAHNGSSIRVATSMRSGTIHRLHISEHGKICAKFPDKAKEVMTGSIPAVPKSGILVIESTAEGQEGDFYAMTMRAKALAERRAKLTEKDYRFHFFPWWEAPEYVLDPASVVMTEADNRYFHDVEGKIGRQLSPEQRAWYVATRDSDFKGEAPLMWQEYPSFPEEAFQVSTEGCYYAEQMARVRKEGRIVRCLPIVPIPVNTFWDIGRGDMTAIWSHQRATQQDRFLWYYENSGEDLIHYVVELQRWAQEKRVIFGTHYLPHEAEHKRIGKTPDSNQSIKEMLEELWPGQRFEIVPRVTNLQAGIQATRGAFASAWFDEEGTAPGVKRLSNYRKKWNKLRGCWSDEEQSDDNAHGSDAFRQWGQEVGSGNTFAGGGQVSRPMRRRGSGMAA
ncbi:MAG: Burkholderia virus Bcep22 [Pseudomonadota bacterium]|jgi:hypothetical protein